MSEEDVRGGLRDAVAEEPPLDFDPDALVTAARRQVRRRALMAVGTATVAVAVAAVALPVALGRSTQVQAGQQPSSITVSAPTSTRIDWPPAHVRPVEYTPDQLRTRGEQMAAHLRQVVPALLRGASEIEVQEFGGEASGQYYEGQTNVNGTIDYTVAGARYSVVVQVWVPGSANDLLDTACAEKTCQRIGEQDGGVLMAGTEDLTGFVEGGKISAVYHLRKDGGVVELAAYNYQLSGGRPATPTIPVTVDQLTGLATDPELGL